MVKILDTTLREGEQTLGVRFTLEQKVEIAEKLDNFGVDYIEAGMPIISDYDKESVKAVANLGLRAKILGHARAKKEDIDAVSKSWCQWAGIFCGINKLSRKYKLGGRSQREVFRMIKESVKYACQKGLHVRYTLEDATRTSTDDLLKIARLVERAGADRFSIADTVGCASPKMMYDLISALKKEINIELEAHCHNDLGLANANALAAYEAGANVIDVTINGLGERAGLTSLQEFTIAMKMLYGENNKNFASLPKLSDLVKSYSGVRLDNLRPITGENAFTHKAKLHREAASSNPETYESIKPELIGRKRTLALPNIIIPKKIDTTELKHHHSNAPGERYVFVDRRFFPESRFYVIGRRVDFVPEQQQAYIDNHAHNCDSYLVFIGDDKDLTGLESKIKMGNVEFNLKSPDTILVPTNINHNLQICSGSGWFFNIVRNPDYNSSIVPATTSFNPNWQLEFHSERKKRSPRLGERPISSKDTVIENPERYIMADHSIMPHSLNKSGLYLALHDIKADKPFQYNMVPHYHETDEMYALFGGKGQELTVDLETDGVHQKVISPALIYHQRGSVHRYAPISGEGKVMIILEERRPGEGYHFIK
jgi:2-isopropylmalate synthase